MILGETGLFEIDVIHGNMFLDPIISLNKKEMVLTNGQKSISMQDMN